MKILRTVAEMRAFSTGFSNNEKLGFVPTMGALHNGHLSLVQAARAENEKVIVSIFVNPTQFLPGEDFEKYPRNEEADLALLANCGVDAVFMPPVEEIYPEGGDLSLVQLSCPVLTSQLCAASRPGHFEGVMLVVSKLFNVVKPQRVYFGQKDYQQCVVVEQLIKDLNFDIDFRMMPIVRENDGLAMSSRNVYLSQQERGEAGLLFQSLQTVDELVIGGERDVVKLRKAMESVLSKGSSLKIDYVEILTAKDLKNAEVLQKGSYVAAVACYFGKTRLIDNLLINIE